MESAATFEGSTRIHIGLGVADVGAAAAFYTTLFGTPPSKERSGYAKFESNDPKVNLSLTQVKDGQPNSNPGSHFGIEMKSTDAVASAIERLDKAGLAPRLEEQVTCCYAVQDKAWVSDPDGNSWEVYVVTQADTKEFVANRQEESACCSTNDQERCC